MLLKKNKKIIVNLAINYGSKIRNFLCILRKLKKPYNKKL